MKHVYLAIAAITIIAGIALIAGNGKNERESKSFGGSLAENAAQMPQEKIQESRPLAPQANNEGPVSIAVQPLEISEAALEWSFQIALDTHLYELNDDMALVAELRDEKGNRFAPLGWEGDPPGGHHREGAVKFKAVAPLPASMTLIIKDVGGVRERKFTW